MKTQQNVALVLIAVAVFALLVVVVGQSPQLGLPAIALLLYAALVIMLKKRAALTVTSKKLGVVLTLTGLGGLMVLGFGLAWQVNRHEPARPRAVTIGPIQFNGPLVELNTGEHAPQVSPPTKPRAPTPVVVVAVKPKPATARRVCSGRASVEAPGVWQLVGAGPVALHRDQTVQVDVDRACKVTRVRGRTATCEARYPPARSSPTSRWYAGACSA